MSIYAKQTTQPSNIKFLQQNQKEHHLNTNKFLSGDMVSTEQFEISKPGRLISSTGREALNKKYCGGTIFYDPVTKIVKVYFQKSLNAVETILSPKN